MSQGRFIVIEGIDGSGTTTLTRGLVDHYRAVRVPVHGTAEPSGGPIGAMIRQALTHRLVVPSTLGPRAPGWSTMALLFAADRLDHVDAEIAPLLRDGVTVLCDRYDLSSLAYQAATAGEEDRDAAVAFIRDANRNARRPDLTLVVNVPADVAQARRAERQASAELYERTELQRRLAEAYRDAERLIPGDRVVHLDGTQPPEALRAAAISAIAALEAG